MKWQIATIKNIVELSRRVKSFSLELEYPSNNIVAGQYYDVRLSSEDGYITERSYSITSSPRNGNFIDFTITKSIDGEVSWYFHNNISEGDKVEIRGPIGNYFNWKPGFCERVIFFAGGTGIAPFMSMIRHKVEIQDPTQFTLLYSVREEEDILFRSELYNYAKIDPQFLINITLTKNSNDYWKGREGRFSSKDILEILGESKSKTINYICGPTSFVEELSKKVLALGMDYNSIKTERFG